MTILDTTSHIDALAVNYLRFGVFSVVNNLWTWIAVATAAVGLWRIRTSSSSSRDVEVVVVTSACRKSDVEPREEDALPVPERCSSSLQTPPVAPKCATVAECSPVSFRETKGRKFTAYFYEEETRCGGDDDNDVAAAKTVEEEEVNRGEWWWSDWEKILRVKKGEVECGWYTHQDLTEINGNVVRLWDDVYGI